MSTKQRLKDKLQKKQEALDITVYERLCKSRMQELLLFSKPLFTFAYKNAQLRGRGCLFQLWPSVSAAADFSKPNSIRPTIHYIPFEAVQTMQYEPALTLTLQYDPQCMWVAVVAIATGDERDSIMHAALMPASVSDSILPSLDVLESFQRLNLSAHSSASSVLQVSTSSASSTTSSSSTSSVKPEPKPTDSDDSEERAEDDDTQASHSLSSDVFPLSFTSLLAPFTPAVHQALASAGGRPALARLLKKSISESTSSSAAAPPSSSSSSPSAMLAVGLPVSAVDGTPFTLSLLTTLCSRPACSASYDLPVFADDLAPRSPPPQSLQHEFPASPSPLSSTSLSSSSSFSSSPSPSIQNLESFGDDESSAHIGANNSSNVENDDAELPPCPIMAVNPNDVQDRRTWCAGCFLQTYCCSECQIEHWKRGHAQNCQRARAAFIGQKLHLMEASLPSESKSKKKRNKKKSNSATKSAVTL